jgi:hypothetical protein
MKELVDTLRTFPGTHLCDPFARHSGTSPLSALLPGDHLEFLRLANGALAFHGYFRLFGSGCAECIDLEWWNDVETWKFAWPQPLSGYLAFGETGWGDPFAYDAQRLAAGDATVFLLDSFEMQPEELAGGFTEFLEDEFIRQAKSSYDSMTRAALTRVGPLDWDEHVTYVPSLLLGGDENPDHIQKMNARAAMIINGDIAAQSEAAADQLPTAIVPYEDEQGRPRMRILWDV